MFEEPTYEEFRKATAFARFRYKYGLIVLILCWVSLLALIFFVYSYGEEMASKPLVYAARDYTNNDYKINGESLEGEIICSCYSGALVFAAANSTNYYYGDQAVSELTMKSIGNKLNKTILGDTTYGENRGFESFRYGT